MPNPSWPDELPQDPFMGTTPTYSQQDNTIRTSTGAGPAKLRRRFTAVPEDMSFQLILSEDQLNTLRDFVRDDLGEVGQFDWIDFSTGDSKTGDPCSYRFKAGYSSVKKEWFADDCWTVTIDLEKMP